MHRGDAQLREHLAALLGEAVDSIWPLTGGCVADVRIVTTATGQRAVVKLGGPSFDREGAMLTHLRSKSDLPVPMVLHAEPDLLLMTHIEHGGGRGWGPHLAELLAELHAVRPEQGGFGFEGPTLIGPIRLENAWSENWASFFRDFRLLPLVEEALRRGHLPGKIHTRLCRYAERLEADLDHAPEPSLIHGDVWSGNVLANADRVVGLIDPSTQYADAEFELAFIALFSTGGRELFERYHELRPIEPAFFDRRVHIYQLFPLLVHVALFGGSYVGQLESVLATLEARRTY